MKNFTEIKRIAIAIFLVTKGVKSEELEPLGITKSLKWSSKIGHFIASVTGSIRKENKTNKLELN
ncbi:hypothetical protein CJF42_07260 [Pseudoalteromonas sp. NBT06-2]|uniref:hypothetical protein n=1 Tax=Pseudoalteromonas sp. NBT06-2 TaxID=2025950 RepID=UPI000BA61AC7|nr:hypothetical protein [Pseudoalteromonas sp. NBT06-2]PAJ75002.1 hypothetical protein CJF42_07260 [Pseudoalteromonas sp. NBT06-2]